MHALIAAAHANTTIPLDNAVHGNSLKVEFTRALHQSTDDVGVRYHVSHISKPFSNDTLRCVAIQWDKSCHDQDEFGLVRQFRAL